MAVYYVKLISGDELIGTVHRRDGHVVVSDPMALEYGETEDGRRYVFMSRYNQFSMDKTIHLSRDSILFMNQVIPEMGEYYVSSIDYCKRVTDENFRKGIALAAQQSISRNETDPEMEGMDENEMEVDLVSKTVH